ncbi:PREDICTED: uncharacterized protein LOC109158675 isoform X2 [Ipomoea nil]|uniref:uncharacterized protein LOC109158675 isoform X2 n=1 Tax=Ipomoea nil TaxID=35883 RepID=UPI000900A928|nr:PREDICTED: uncharacterized protein LOC109158675 isoform X2 [Ipomoea nil]
MMGRSLSPILRKELENLDKDADSRKSAIKALKSYVGELDSKAIPLFLAKVSETKETGTSSGECTISLYEVLARVHGPKILPQIDNIMATIIKTLRSSAGSFALHQACSKVVPAIARYGMDPTTSEEKKRYIIHSLAKPLSDCLLATQEGLSSGAALCLKALVETDNWRFASNEIVNEVCRTVSGALEKHAQAGPHMALVMSLAKHNRLLVEAYARLLIRSGLRVLKCGNGEGNSQKRLLAILMITSLMRCLDPRSIFSELGMVIEHLVMCQSDKMQFVRGAAFEALQLAKRICCEKGSNLEKGIEPTNGSNLCESDDQSPITTSPESETADSLLSFDPILDSSNSTSLISRDLGSDQKSVKRRLWRRCGNGALKEEILSQVARQIAIQNSEQDELTTNHGDYSDLFAGYFPGNGRNGFVRNRTPSPQRSRSHIKPENLAIFTDSSLDFLGKNTRPSSCKLESPRRYRENGEIKSSVESEQAHRSSESTSSSTEDALADTESQCFTKAEPESKTKSEGAYTQQTSKCKMICGVLVAVLSILAFLLWDEDQDGFYNLVPT